MIKWQLLIICILAINMVVATQTKNNTQYILTMNIGSGSALTDGSMNITTVSGEQGIGNYSDLVIAKIGVLYYNETHILVTEEVPSSPPGGGTSGDVAREHETKTGTGQSPYIIDINFTKQVYKSDELVVARIKLINTDYAQHEGWLTTYLYNNTWYTAEVNEILHLPPACTQGTLLSKVDLCLYPNQTDRTPLVYFNNNTEYYAELNPEVCNESISLANVDICLHQNEAMLANTTRVYRNITFPHNATLGEYRFRAMFEPTDSVDVLEVESKFNLVTYRDYFLTIVYVIALITLFLIFSNVKDRIKERHKKKKVTNDENSSP